MRAVRWAWIGVSACGLSDPALEAPEASEAFPWEGMVQVPSQRGCGDMVLAGSAAGDTQAVFLYANGLAELAHRRGRPISATRPLGASSPVRVVYQEGTDLTSATCVGAYPFPGPDVLRDFEAVSGIISMTVTPDPGGSVSLPFATVDAEVRDAVFVDAATGRSFRAPTLTFTDVGVGLYPP